MAALRELERGGARVKRPPVEAAKADPEPRPGTDNGMAHNALQAIVERQADASQHNVRAMADFLAELKRLVEASATRKESAPVDYEFTVKRDHQGYIERIHAKAKPQKGAP